MLLTISNRGKLQFVLHRANINESELIDLCVSSCMTARKSVSDFGLSMRSSHKKEILWLEKHKNKNFN